MADSQTKKHAQIIKLGTPVYYGPTEGCCIKYLGDDTYRLSLSAGGVNWVDDVHIDKLEVR
jgi:hypothetical protein